MKKSKARAGACIDDRVGLEVLKHLVESCTDRDARVGALKAGR